MNHSQTIGIDTANGAFFLHGENDRGDDWYTKALNEAGKER